MNTENLEGNISTIAVWVYVIVAPYIAQYISQEVFLAIVGILLAIWSSANLNTFPFLGNDNKECDCEIVLETEEDLINEEYTSDDGC